MRRFDTMHYFLNEKYQFLLTLYDNSHFILNKYIVPLSQNQLVKICRFSKSRVNQLIKEFILIGLLEQNTNSHGRYIITDKAIKVIDQIKYLEVIDDALF